LNLLLVLVTILTTSDGANKNRVLEDELQTEPQLTLDNTLISQSDQDSLLSNTVDATEDKAWDDFKLLFNKQYSNNTGE